MTANDTTTGESHESVEATPVDATLTKPSNDSDEDSLTTNRKLRWDLLASVVAGAACVSLLGLIIAAALGVAALGAVSQAWFLLYATVVLTSVVWTFGGEALGKAREAMQSD